MLCFVLAFLYLLFVHGLEGITSHSVTGCTDRVLLNCSVSEMIHVERITFYNGTDCNQAVTEKEVCRQPLTGSDTGLVASCNGKTTCNEILHDSYCPGSKAAKVDYRCIPGNDVIDMCDEFIIDNTNRIFLSTPNYPFSATFTDISACRCSIRGSSITSIQILELVLQTLGDGSKSSLEINFVDVTYKTESINDSTRRVYNKRLSTAPTTAEIILNHNNLNRQYLWIEIQGVSMHVACNVGTTSASSTISPPKTTTNKSPVTLTPYTYLSSSSSSPSPSSSSTSPSSPSSSTSSPPPSPSPSSSTTTTSTTTTPQTADTKSHSQDSTPVIAGSVVGAVILIAIVIVIFIFIYRRKELRSGERESNPYSGLDQTQRVSGSDGTYQELNTVNLTPQYNSVSQNTHNEYYNLN